nr:class I adenylate-forming enzyme family protein [Vulcanisaeta sp. JCM 16159]
MVMKLRYPYQNPVDALLNYLKVRPHDTFLINEHGLSLTYENLYKSSAKLANSLDILDVGYGDKVAVVMNNSIEAVISLFAVWMLGASAVLIDPLTISEDLDYQLGDSVPKVVITDKSVIERKIAVLSKYRVVGVGVSGQGVLSFQELLGSGSITGFRPAEVRGDDVGLIYYYAGIAGRTMQVWHTYFSLYSGPYAFGEAIGLSPKDSVLVVAQLSHILGLTGSCRPS